MAVFSDKEVIENVKRNGDLFLQQPKAYVEYVENLVGMLLSNSVTMQAIIKVLMLDSGKYEDNFIVDDLDVNYDLEIEQLNENSFNIKLERQRE